jgi:hypothetical protein
MLIHLDKLYGTPFALLPDQEKNNRERRATMKANRQNPRAIARTRTRTRAYVGVKELVQENPHLLAAVLAVPVSVGLWAAAWFVGAMITGGGPLALVTGWFQAVTGM